MLLILDVSKLPLLKPGNKVRLIVQTVKFNYKDNELIVKNVKSSSQTAKVSLNLLNPYPPEIITKGEIIDVEGTIQSVSEKNVDISAFLIRVVNGAVLDEGNFDILRDLTSLKPLT